jgi:hypothetical protein
MHDRLGRVGYESYNAHQGGKNYKGEPIPTWDENTRDDIKAAWVKAAGDAADEALQVFASNMRKLLAADTPPQEAVDTALDMTRQHFQTPKAGRPAITQSATVG